MFPWFYLGVSDPTAEVHQWDLNEKPKSDKANKGAERKGSTRCPGPDEKVKEENLSKE